MLILHVITSLSDGGAESLLYTLCSNDKDNSHIVISMMDLGKYGPMLQHQDIPVYTLNMPRSRLTLSGIIRLRRIIISSRPDVVQTWMYHANLVGGIISRIAGCQHIVWGIYASDLNLKFTSYKLHLTMKLCALISGWIPKSIISCADKSISLHKDLGYVDRFSVIHSGYDITQFLPDENIRISWRTQWGFKSTDFLIGFVARWDPLKNHIMLLQALSNVRSKLPDCYCVLVGNGCDKNNIDLLNMIDSFGLSDIVVLCGMQKNIPNFMNGIDVHVLPSLTEGFPNVVAESMACGIPNIVTDVGDTALIVDNTGWVVPSQDIVKFSNALELAFNAMKSPTEWLKRKNNCREHIINNFNLQTLIDNYSSVWRNAIKK